MERSCTENTTSQSEKACCTILKIIIKKKNTKRECIFSAGSWMKTMKVVSSWSHSWKQVDSVLDQLNWMYKFNSGTDEVIISVSGLSPETPKGTPQLQKAPQRQPKRELGRQRWRERDRGRERTATQHYLGLASLGCGTGCCCHSWAQPLGQGHSEAPAAARWRPPRGSAQAEAPKPA